MGPTPGRYFTTSARALFRSSAYQCRQELKLQEKLVFFRSSQCHLQYILPAQVLDMNSRYSPRLRVDIASTMHCDTLPVNDGNVNQLATALYPNWNRDRTGANVPSFFFPYIFPYIYDFLISCKQLDCLRSLRTLAYQSYRQKEPNQNQNAQCFLSFHCTHWGRY